MESLDSTAQISKYESEASEFEDETWRYSEDVYSKVTIYLLITIVWVAE
jgi:hypothetical protein